MCKFWPQLTGNLKNMHTRLKANEIMPQ